jgi:hypothetical protein
MPHVSSIFTSTAFRLAFRDDRDTPLMPRRDGEHHTGNQNFGKAKYFCAWVLTATPAARPSGKSMVGDQAKQTSRV